MQMDIFGSIKASIIVVKHNGNIADMGLALAAYLLSHETYHKREILCGTKALWLFADFQ